MERRRVARSQTSKIRAREAPAGLLSCFRIFSSLDRLAIGARASAYDAVVWCVILVRNRTTTGIMVATRPQLPHLWRVLMNLAANLFLFFLAAYGAFGLTFPRTVMGFRSFPGRNSWITGGALYKTPARTRLTCGFLLGIALFGFAVELYSTR